MGRSSVSFRAVLAGCGAVSSDWLRAISEAPALADRIAVVGLNDIDLGAARRAAERHDLAGAKTDTDLARLLDDARPDPLFEVAVLWARRAINIDGPAMVFAAIESARTRRRVEIRTGT